MTTAILPFGAQVAPDLRDSSTDNAPGVRAIQTLDDLVQVWRNKPPKAAAVLGTTVSLLADYLGKPLEQITLNKVHTGTDGFRKFLESRKYKQNSVKTYVNHRRILLKSARELGWEPTEETPEAWHEVLAIAAREKCSDVARFLAQLRPTPGEVQIDDVNQWVAITTQQGFAYKKTKTTSNRFWRVLRDCGYAGELPKLMYRDNQYGIPLRMFPANLKREVEEIKRWKQARFSVGRSKRAKHRRVTSEGLEQFLSGLYGFAVSSRPDLEITALAQLVQESIVGAFAEWCMNERKIDGESIQRKLRLLSAAMSQHPAHKSVDLSWLKPLGDSLPVSTNSELKSRKAAKYLPFDVVKAIPAKMHAERSAASKKGIVNLASHGMDELLMTWLPILPWRQRNIRETRISGPSPNLFKGPIPPLSEIDKPAWVERELQRNPSAEFWQFRFSADETKTGVEPHSVLPRQLIEPLEEYLKEFRPHLVHGKDPGLLFLNRAGQQMRREQVTDLVSTITLRYGGRRVTPHIFRDIVAFGWLKSNPKDFLSLSKMLWHSDPAFTIRVYGVRFNESSGVCDGILVGRARVRVDSGRLRLLSLPPTYHEGGTLQADGSLADRRSG